MIPGGAFTSSALTNTFRIPNDMPYTPLLQTVWGGVSIGDASGGRLVKYWIISYDGSVISVKPIDGPVAFTLPVTDVTSLSLAFDNNMGLAIAYTKPDGAYFYYFDSLTSKYITRSFAEVNSCRVCVDDARSFYTSNSDVFLVYTLNNKLYYRKQRDRYDVEIYIGDTTSRLLKVGQNIDNRFQIELGADRTGPPPTPIPQPRIVGLEGTLFPLEAPKFLSVIGLQPNLVSPIINSIYGDVYPMPVPVILDITGKDVSLNAPTITFLSGSIYSQPAPTVDSFESVFALVKPSIVSIEGTLARSALTGYVGSVLSKNPYLYYRLGETTGKVAADFSDHKRDGVYTEDASLFTTGGLLLSDNDKAIATVGVAGKHGVTYNGNTSTLWNKSWSVETVLNVKGPARGGAGTVFQGSGIPNAGSRFPELAVLGFTSNSFKFYLGYTGIGQIFVTEETFTIGTTFHVVLRYNTSLGTTELLVNNVVKATGTTSYTDFPGPLNIGFAEFQANDYYNSNITIDEFAVYDFSLNDAQVQRDYQLAIQNQPVIVKSFQPTIVSVEGTTPASYVPSAPPGENTLTFERLKSISTNILFGGPIIEESTVPLTAPVLISVTGTTVTLTSPTLVDVTGTPVTLTSPTLVDVTGTPVPLTAPVLISVTGTEVTLPIPTLINVQGAEVPLTAPAIASVIGTPVPLTAPVLVDFTGTPVRPPTPQLNSFEGTPVAAPAPKPSGNDIMFSEPPPSNSDISFDKPVS